MEIYCSLHLESFFIVVMLTLEEHSESRLRRISQPVDSNPVVLICTHSQACNVVSSYPHIRSQLKAR